MYIQIPFYTDGFRILLKEHNLTCAETLLRLKMDNYMCIYAVFIAKDICKVIDCIIEGKSINKQRYNLENRMTDGYPKKLLLNTIADLSMFIPKPADLLICRKKHFIKQL